MFENRLKFQEVGELSISIDSSTYSGKECYLIQANSNGIVDTIPVGTNITAYVTPKLESLEHTQHEYVNVSYLSVGPSVCLFFFVICSFSRKM